MCVMKTPAATHALVRKWTETTRHTHMGRRTVESADLPWYGKVLFVAGAEPTYPAGTARIDLEGPREGQKPPAEIGPEKNENKGSCGPHPSFRVEKEGVLPSGGHAHYAHVLERSNHLRQLALRTCTRVCVS